MGTHVRLLAVVFFVTLGVLSARCSGNRVTLSPTPTPTPSPTLVPVLIYPTNGVSIPQNNPAIGCSALPGATRGLGFQIEFQWTAPSLMNGVVSYEINAVRVGSDLPAIDTMVEATDFTETQCNSFVVDANLHGWQWRVRAKDALGQFADWAPWASFQFSPCRLTDGTPCRS